MYSKAQDTMYCAIPKIGSSFLSRVFLVMGKEIVSFNIDIIIINHLKTVLRYYISDFGRMLGMYVDMWFLLILATPFNIKL